MLLLLPTAGGGKALPRDVKPTPQKAAVSSLPPATQHGVRSEAEFLGGRSEARTVLLSPRRQ